MRTISQASDIGRRNKAIVLITIAALGFPAGCRRESSVITVIPRSTGTLLWDSLRKGAEDGLHGTEFHIQWEAPQDDGDVGSQLSLVEGATARKDRGLVFVPDETLASRSVVLEAIRQQIPVVVVDDEFGPPAGPLLSYVSNDEVAAVRLAAQRLAEQLHGHGSVAVIGISPRQEGSISREVLLERSLAQIAPGIRLMLRQWGDAVITHQQQICQELFSRASPPDAIIALSSTATRGAYYAKIAESRPPRTIIIGFDQDDRDMLLPVRTGDLDAVVIQDTRKIGERAVSNLLAQLSGQPFPTQTLVAPLLVTRESLDRRDVASLLGQAAEVTSSTSLDDRTGWSHSTGPEAVISAFREEARKHELQPGVQPIGRFIRLPGKHPGITVQGTVIFSSPMLEVQDETSSVFIANYTALEPLKPGDVVAVHGDLTSERFRSRIENASVKVLWSERPIAPLAVTATQLTSEYRGEFIEVEGSVLSEARTDGIRELILRDGKQTFRALLYGSSNTRRQHLPPGSRVRLRGTATALPELTHGIYPFTVLADQVQLLYPAPWWTPVHIAVLGLVAAGILGGLQWLLHTVQRWHLRSVLRQREQMAFEIHDTLAQSFTGIAYQLLAARAERNGVDAVQAHVANALSLVRMSHREASQTIGSLRPQYRDAPGMLNALKLSAERLSEPGALAIYASLTGRSAQLPLEVTEAFFRIGQEAINNAIQHGHCRVLYMDLHVSRRLATLSFRDDGVGFSPIAASPGLGITGMRRRADAIKATFTLLSTPGNGATVTVKCPLVFTSSRLYRVRAKLTGNLLPGPPG